MVLKKPGRATPRQPVAEARARKTGFGKRAEPMITAAAVHEYNRARVHDPRSPEALLRQQECLERLHNACEQGLIAPNLLTAYAGTPHQVAQRRAFLKRKDPDSYMYLSDCLHSR